MASADKVRNTYPTLPYPTLCCPDTPCTQMSTQRSVESIPDEGCRASSRRDHTRTRTSTARHFAATLACAQEEGML